MKKLVRSFIIEYRSKRSKSRSVRGGESFRFADQSAERIFACKESRNESAWRSLFKHEERSP